MSKTIVSYKDGVHSTTYVSSIISICDKEIKDLQKKLESKIIERYRLISLLEELDRIRDSREKENEPDILDEYESIADCKANNFGCDDCPECNHYDECMKAGPIHLSREKDKEGDI